MNTTAPICFGDVVKLNVKTPAGGAESVSLGFFEHKNDEFLLIVPPVKESASAKFQEAEFIVAPTRCEKPPVLGTPLNYKQSFVLLTSSQFEDYSLNNKMSNNDTIGLQCCDVKGEMYLAIEKEGYTLEANVMDGDEGLDLVVVDSNRIRKQYNNKFGFYTKKSDVLGGYVSCGGKKNKPLSFTITKMVGETKTKQFVSKQIPRRRRSTLTNDPTKGDETTRRASRVGSDVSDGSALSPTSAMSPVAVATEAKPTEEAKSSEESAFMAPVEAPASAATSAADAQEPRISTASTAESAASAPEASPSAPAPATASAPVVDLLSEVSLEEKTSENKGTGSALMSPMVPAPEATSSAASSTANVPTSETANVAAPVPTTATASSSSSPSTTTTPDAKPSVTTSTQLVVPPSPKKLGQQPSALTVTSEAEGLEGDKVDSNCLGGGQCLVM